jgi:hypothetical protein
LIITVLVLFVTFLIDFYPAIEKWFVELSLKKNYKKNWSIKVLALSIFFVFRSRL